MLACRRGYRDGCVGRILGAVAVIIITEARAHEHAAGIVHRLSRFAGNAPRIDAAAAASFAAARGA